MSKKIIIILLAVCMTISLFACAPNETSSTTTTQQGGGKTTAAPTDVAPDPVTIVFTSPAWQADMLAAYAEVVDEWNSRDYHIKIEYVQNDWGSLGDYLTTAFETGDVPDLFHNSGYNILNFARREYLENLYPLITEELFNDLHPVILDTIYLKEGELYGVPFITNTQISLYNKKIFKEEGIEIPTRENPWTFEDFTEIGKKLTIRNDDGTVERWGIGIGMSNPVSRFKEYGVRFGAEFLYQKGDGGWEVIVGDDEIRLLTWMYDVYNTDKIMDPNNLSIKTQEILPLWYNEKVVVIPNAGAWMRNDISREAPDGFEWGVIPYLADKTMYVGSDSQAMSIPVLSSNKDEAMEVLEFFNNTENMAKIAMGDWLLPARKSSLALDVINTDEYGWNAVVETTEFMVVAKFLTSPFWSELELRVISPTLQDLLYDKITVEEAAARILEEGNRIIELDP